LFCELVERHAGFVEDRPTPVIMRALLQASKFGDNKWKSRSIQIAKTARPEDITIDDQAYLAYRQSFVLRSEGQEKEARRVVEEALQVLSSCSELGPVLNAIYGLLLSSLSWTYIAQGQFEKAINVFSSWTAGATGCERRPEQKLVMIRGIASKHLGKLDDAIHDLEAVSGVSISRARLYVLANLGDAYCEKGQSEVAYKMLSSAAKVAGCNLPNTPLNDTYHRTLLLSLSEACSYLGRYDESNEILRRLKDHFEQKRCTAGNDKQKHVRVLILLAQNQHRHATDPAAWVDTRDMWYESIRLTTEYQILSTSGWDYAVMCLSLYHALKMAWEEEKNGTWLQKASNIFSSGVQDHFWMRTLPTYWVPYMLEQDLGISDALRSCIESCRKLS
jgi:tetratricopeptide (TPR) repeat protein